MFKLVLEKAEEPEIKLPTFAGSLKKLEFQKNIYFCFIDDAKAFDYMDHNKLWEKKKIYVYIYIALTIWTFVSKVMSLHITI